MQKPSVSPNTSLPAYWSLLPNVEVKDKANLTLLFLCPSIPHPDVSSGGKRATYILQYLSTLFEVIIIVKNIDAHSERMAHLLDYGIKIIPFNNLEETRASLPQPEIIIFSYYYTYFDFFPLIKTYPQALLVADTVDVHWVREERSLSYEKTPTPGKVAQNKEKEKTSYGAADVIWAVTKEDQRSILSELGSANVHIVSNIHPQEVETYRDNGTKNLFFIGSYNHLPNLSAAITLATEILPKVRQRHPEARLFLAGTHAPEEIRLLGQLEGVTFAGSVAEKELKDLYDQAFMVVAPLFFGAGIKGKIGEAIVHRTPVLTNAIGNEGINLLHQKEALIAELDEMPDLICKALNRDYDFESMTSLAIQKLNQLTAPKVVQQNIQKTFFPTVSICIVTWNRLSLIRRCLESLLQNTHYPHYRILVYSNGCQDGTKEYLEDLALRHPFIFPTFARKNEGFVRPNNHLMSQFPEDPVVLLNNDVEVTPHWLMNLYKMAAANPWAGIIGPKICFPDGRLQEFGAEIFPDGSGINYGRNGNAEDKAFSKPIQVAYVSGSAMYIKRSTIKQIGGFDAQFHPCYFEDSDYCYTARMHQIGTIVTPHSLVYHDEGKTSGTNLSTGMKRFQIINQEKFRKKHLPSIPK